MVPTTSSLYPQKKKDREREEEKNLVCMCTPMSDILGLLLNLKEEEVR